MERNVMYRAGQGEGVGARWVDPCGNSALFRGGVGRRADHSPWGSGGSWVFPGADGGLFAWSGSPCWAGGWRCVGPVLCTDSPRSAEWPYTICSSLCRSGGLLQAGQVPPTNTLAGFTHSCYILAICLFSPFSRPNSSGLSFPPSFPFLAPFQSASSPFLSPAIVPSAVGPVPP